jgi:hypothetical protein
MHFKIEYIPLMSFLVLRQWAVVFMFSMLLLFLRSASAVCPPYPARHTCTCLCFVGVGLISFGVV